MEEVFKNMPTPCGRYMGDSEHRRLIHSATELLIFMLETVIAWIERSRQRRTSANLPDYMLKDIGVSRADAWQEAEKPFWRI